MPLVIMAYEWSYFEKVMSYWSSICRNVSQRCRRHFIYFKVFTSSYLKLSTPKTFYVQHKLHRYSRYIDSVSSNVFIEVGYYNVYIYYSWTQLFPVLENGAVRVLYWCPFILITSKCQVKQFPSLIYSFVHANLNRVLWFRWIGSKWFKEREEPVVW